MSTQHILDRVRRDLLLSRLCRYLWAALLVGALLAAPLIGAGVAIGVQVVLLGAMWFMITAGMVRQSRLAMQWPAMISAGKLEEAEQQIREALSAFTPVGSLKVLCVYHLARIRLAQKKWQDAVELARAVLRHRQRGLKGISNATLQVLAEASLNTGDLPAAGEALDGIRASSPSLEAALPLLQLETRYLARVADWGRAVNGIEDKVTLAELMPTEPAALVQGLLAVACERIGRSDWRDYLRARCDLLTDMPRLAAAHPELTTIWAPAAPQPEDANAHH